MEKQSIEVLKLIKSNTQIRYQNENNCVLISVHGPYQIGSQKANMQAILDIQIKFETDKSLEQQLRYIFEQVINLQEYPQQLIRINCIIQINTINIFSTLCNAIMISLIHQGISLNKTIFGLTLDSTIFVSQVCSQDILYIDNKTSQTKDQLIKKITEVQTQTKQFEQFLRSYLYEYYANSNMY